MNRNDLKTMYGTTPESFKHRVSFALKQTEEKPVKHTMRTVLIATAIVVLLTAVAYAAFSSQVAEFFGKFYGNDMKQWLEQGDVAVPEQSLELNGVVFTLDEVVYRSNGLYGVGTIGVKEGSNVVLITQDYTPDAPFGYDVYGIGGVPEEAPDGTPTNADVASEKGAKLLMVDTIPDQIGVDGGPLLNPPTVGTSLKPMRDGSVQFLFEMSDATVIAEGAVYAIKLWSSVTEVTPDGQMDHENRQAEYWTVDIRPEPMGEQTQEPAAKPAVITQNIGAIQITVPGEYDKNGTLPIYAATVRDFGANLDPALFNISGVAKTENGLVIYNDEAQLSWSPETLFYNEYQGTYNGNYRNPESEPWVFPKPTLSQAAADLAASVYSGLREHWEGITLTKTELAGITLDESKAEVDALLKALNVEGYTCDFALDMDVERIQSMGAIQNQFIEENQFNSPILDYLLAAQENEGYYLHYGNGVRSERYGFDVYAYVTENGIVDMHLRDWYIRGDVYATPDTLVSPEAIMERLPVEIANSRFSDMMVDHIISMELAYAPARVASAPDGMVFTPAWYVIYQDVRGVKSGYDSYAIFNAVDGTLIASQF